MEKSAEEVRCGDKHALGVGKGRGCGGMEEGEKEKK